MSESGEAWAAGSTYEEFTGRWSRMLAGWSSAAASGLRFRLTSPRWTMIIALLSPRGSSALSRIRLMEPSFSLHARGR
jgi:hypothetical protein